MAAEENAGWLFGAAASIIATLASAVAFMFKLNESKNATAIVELKKSVKDIRGRCDTLEVQNDECIKDRDEIRVKLAKVETELQFVKTQAVK